MTRSTTSTPPSPSTPGSTGRTSPGSIAHATMLGEQGIIAEEEADKIVARASKILLEEIEAGKVEFTTDSEDIHMNMEAMLTAAHRRRGQAPAHRPQPERSGGRGLPPVCQRGDPRHRRTMLLDLEKVLVQPGRGQPGRRHARLHPPAAGPAHHLCPSPDGLRQHVLPGRRPGWRTAVKRMDECPLGSGALAGTTYPIDRLCRPPERWALTGPCDNSLDGVSDRDFCAGVSVGPVHPDDAPLPLLRGDHPLVQLGVQIHRAGRRLCHRLLHHAPEEKPRCGRAGPGQDRAGVRRPHEPAHRA